jgi:hypothetical protein
VTDVPGPWWNDDRTLLKAVDTALRAARAVPPGFVESGKAAYACRCTDAELAALTHDSHDSRHEPAEVAPAASAGAVARRTVTFAAPGLTVELYLVGDGLLGQLVPEQPGQVELHQFGGETRTADLDEIGCFTFRPRPSGSFRLRCHTRRGRAVVTGWIT